MRRAPGERERPDPERCGAAAAMLAALQASDVERLIRAVGPHPRVVVDRGREQTGAGWPFLLRALGLASPSAPAWEQRSVNGGPGLVGRRDGRVVVVIVLAGAVGAVTDVWIVANPDKLGHWNGTSP